MPLDLACNSFDFLANLRMSLVPVGMLLESAPSLNDREIVSRSCDKLQAGGEIFISESTWYRQRRKAAEVADPAQGVWKDEIGFQIQIQRCRCDGLRCSCQHVEGIKQSLHLRLQDFSHLQSLQVVRGGILFVDVA